MSKRKLSGEYEDDLTREKEEESDDSLPSLQTQTKKSWHQGDLVFAKFNRFPYWPAVFQRYDTHPNRAYVHFFDELSYNTKKVFRIPVKSIKPYASEEREDIIYEGTSKYESYKKGVERAEEYVTKRALGKVGNFFEDAVEDLCSTDEETSPAEQNNREIADTNAERENLCQSEFVEFEVKPPGSDKKRELVTNPELLEIIKNPDTKEYLKRIDVDLEKSDRRRIFEIGTKKERADLKWRAGYGSLNDEESTDVLETLLDWYKQLYPNPPSKFIRYVTEVWLPEALIRAISLLEKVSREKAEKIYCS